MQEFTPNLRFDQPKAYIEPHQEFVDLDGNRKKFDTEGYEYVLIPMNGIQGDIFSQSPTVTTEAKAGPKIKISMKINAEGTQAELANINMLPFAQRKTESQPAPMSLGIISHLPLASLNAEPRYDYRMPPAVTDTEWNYQAEADDENEDQYQETRKRKVRLSFLRGEISKRAVAGTMLVSVFVVGGLALAISNDGTQAAKACASALPIVGPAIAQGCEIQQFIGDVTNVNRLFGQLVGNK